MFKQILSRRRAAATVLVGLFGASRSTGTAIPSLASKGSGLDSIAGGISTGQPMARADVDVALGQSPVDLVRNGDQIIRSSQIGTGAIAEPIRNILRRVDFNVVSYGAVGDGTTDDTAAIQNAIDAATATFVPTGWNSGGRIVAFPPGTFKITGLVVKKGVSLRGAGSTRTILKVIGTNAIGIKCPAAETNSYREQVSYGSFEGFALVSGEAAPTAQIMWNAVGFSRWDCRDVLFNWFGGCTGISVKNAVPASLGGPSQWHNRFHGCEWISRSSQPVGGVAMSLGDSSTTYEGVTTWAWYGGQVAGGGTGTGLSLDGASSCVASQLCIQGCAVGLSVGSASGARRSVSNVFYGCYWEGCATNRQIKATAYGTRIDGSFITGGVDATDRGTGTAITEYGYDDAWRIPGALRIAGMQVAGPRNTGWTAATGVANKGAFDATAAGKASNTYDRAELQRALNRIAALEARLVALDGALRTHGLIGS